MCNKYCKKMRPQSVEYKGGSLIWRHMFEARDIFVHEI